MQHFASRLRLLSRPNFDKKPVNTGFLFYEKMKINNEKITSRSNPTVLLVGSLTEKKYREKHRLFRTDGVKLAEELFSRGILPELVLLRESSVGRLSALIEKAPDCTALVLADGVFDKVSDEKSPEGIICVAKHLDNFRKIATIDNNGVVFDDWRQGRLLLLESMRDPGNFGTVLRSALALGVDRVIVSEDSVDPYNPRVLRAAMGAVFGVKIDAVPSMPDAIGVLRSSGRRVFAAALDRTAVGLDRLELRENDCFAVGNEGHGLSSEAIAACDRSVFIPITDGAESLNAAAAAAILLWEQRRIFG